MLDDCARVVREHHVHVGESGGVLAGILVLVSREGSTLLDNVAVSPEFQGCGAGSSLIRFAEEKAKTMGYGHIDFYTHELMVENLGMYGRRGYVEVERLTEKGYRRITMRKSLAGRGAHS